MDWKLYHFSLENRSLCRFILLIDFNVVRITAYNLGRIANTHIGIIIGILVAH